MTKRAVGTGVVSLFIALLGASGCGSHTASPPSGRPARTSPATAVAIVGSVFAVVAKDGAAVDQVSLRTGAVLRRVAPAVRGRLTIEGVARLSRGKLLLTYATGPACSSGVAGCGPRPNTCGAEVDQLTLTTGKLSLLWQVGRGQRLSEPRPSPDGSMLAARMSPCVPSYFNDHLVVRRLRDGKTWTIGAAVPRCHALGAPAWTADSAHLLVTYAAPGPAPSLAFADGVCQSIPGGSALVELDANHQQPQLIGVRKDPPDGCTYEALATAGASTYVVQACGASGQFLQGPATLVRLDDHLRPAQSWRIGDCTDGNAVAADPAQGVVVAAYLFCNPPLAGDQVGEPMTVLDRVDGNVLRRITAVNYRGTAFDDVTFG